MPSTAEEWEPLGGIGQSAQRALHVIEVLSILGPSRLGDLAREAGLHKSTAHHFLRVLQNCGYVVQSPTTQAYRLTLKLFEVGYRVVASTGLRERSLPFMESLMHETGETVWLVMLDQGEAVRVEKIESHAVMRLSEAMGTRVPLHATAAGKAILAGNWPARWRQLLRPHMLPDGSLPTLTEHTITNIDALQEQCESIRERGYAVDDEESSAGIRAVAAPIADFAGDVSAAVSVAAPSFRLPRERLPEFGRTVAQHAREIETMAEQPPTRTRATIWNQPRTTRGASSGPGVLYRA